MNSCIGALNSMDLTDKNLNVKAKKDYIDSLMKCQDFDYCKVFPVIVELLMFISTLLDKKQENDILSFLSCHVDIQILFCLNPKLEDLISSKLNKCVKDKSMMDKNSHTRLSTSPLVSFYDKSDLLLKRKDAITDNKQKLRDEFFRWMRECYADASSLGASKLDDITQQFNYKSQSILKKENAVWFAEFVVTEMITMEMHSIRPLDSTLSKDSKKLQKLHQRMVQDNSSSEKAFSCLIEKTNDFDFLLHSKLKLIKILKEFVDDLRDFKQDNFKRAAIAVKFISFVDYKPYLVSKDKITFVCSIDWCNIFVRLYEKGYVGCAAYFYNIYLENTKQFKDDMHGVVSKFIHSLCVSDSVTVKTFFMLFSQKIGLKKPSEETRSLDFKVFAQNLNHFYYVDIISIIKSPEILNALRIPLKKSVQVNETAEKTQPKRKIVPIPVNPQPPAASPTPNFPSVQEQLRHWITRKYSIVEQLEELVKESLKTNYIPLIKDANDIKIRLLRISKIILDDMLNLLEPTRLKEESRNIIRAVILEKIEAFLDNVELEFKPDESIKEKKKVDNIRLNEVNNHFQSVHHRFVAFVAVP
ncbi:hypothetical protein O9G_003640 [Rozella allomycis CSF55]|uniref:Uncharacterized protein n=1 Tax=Rozella allomycis (strain CSF55) TaxID=988480 RepID=A0A075B2I5_ROZAC|nr:hypothetical protein O9G_003640 [Rozella allomycis CSF55]|eukprot:EPZ35151.1 hypothetical protein O9G_003640 [Rozella allomycis CSF55]